MTALPPSPLQMVLLSSRGTPPAQLGSKLAGFGAPVLMPGQTSSLGATVNKGAPNLQMVTLVPKGGSPVTLADQTGAPFATTGTGALVFADGPVLNDATFTGGFSIDSVLTQAGNASVPAIAFQNDPDTGVFSSGDGSWSVSSNGVQMFDVTPVGIVVHGDITYSGVQHGAYHDPLTNQGDLYYRGPAGSTRLPLGPAGTVLLSDGSNLVYATPQAGITVGATPVAAGTNTYVLFDNNGHVGEYAISGTGSVAMTNAPVFTGDPTPNADRTVSLGSATNRWATVYSNIVSVGPGGLYVTSGPVTWIALNNVANGDIMTKADGRIGFTNNVNNATAPPDTVIARVSAGVMEVNNGTAGTKAELQFVTKPPGTNTTAGATTAFVTAAVAAGLLNYLPLAGGNLTGTLQVPVGAAATPSLKFALDQSGLWQSSAGAVDISIAGGHRTEITSSSYKLLSTMAFGWTSGTPAAVLDTRLLRDGVGVIGQQNGTNPQTYRLYNTFTDFSNYERLSLGWNANVATLTAEAAGTGTVRSIQIGNASFTETISGVGAVFNRIAGASLAALLAVQSGALSAAGNLSTVLFQPTFAQSGSSSYTVLDINPTETSVGTGPNYLLRGHIGAGANVFSVDRAGNLAANGGAFAATITGVTEAPGTNNTNMASTAFVNAAVAAGGGGVTAPTFDSTAIQQTDAGGWTFGTVLQITQGTQVFSRTFTAVDATHPIEVDCMLLFGAGAANNNGVVGLFIDGAANAVVQQSFTLFAQAFGPTRLFWRGVLAAGAHTFTLRFSGGTGIYLLRNDASNAASNNINFMRVSEVGVGPIGPQGPPGTIGAKSTLMVYAAAGTFAAPTTTKVVMAAPTVNVGGTWDAANNRWTPLAGTYVISAAACFTSTGAASGLNAYLYKNGVQIAFANNVAAAAGYNASATLSVVVSANGTDYFELWAATGVASIGIAPLGTYLSAFGLP